MCSASSGVSGLIRVSPDPFDVSHVVLTFHLSFFLHTGVHLDGCIISILEVPRPFLIT